jgi:two-component system, LytTR family, response regulator
MLMEFSNVTIAGVSSNTNYAEVEINSSRPDLLVLGINEREDGVTQVLNGVNYSPQIILIATSDDFALKAFDFNAIDYIIKPICRDRLLAALSKVKTSTKKAPIGFFVKNNQEVRFIAVIGILWIEIKDCKTIFHHEEGSYSINQSLVSIEEQLKNRGFFRANRQQLINLSKIQSVCNSGSSCFVELSNGKRILLSKRQRSVFIPIYEELGF